MLRHAHRVIESSTRFRWAFVFTMTILTAADPYRALAGDDNDRRVITAWNNGFVTDGGVRGIDAASPWAYATPERTTGLNVVLREANGLIYAVSHGDDSITALDPASLTPVQTYELTKGSAPIDIAVVSETKAFVTREMGTHLMRLDLTSGATTDIVDLGVFADPDGVPDMRFMAVHEGKLIVQLRRRNDNTGEWAVPPYLAVVDIETDELIDADPVSPGVQAIALAGTAPRFKMHVQPELDRLLVSATGELLDHGGIEVVDLNSLSSLGLVIAEEDGMTGADIGAFVMVSLDEGFLTNSTDFGLSSHLVKFSLTGGVLTKDLIVIVGYFVPAMVFDEATNTIFMPDGSTGLEGLHVFDASTGAKLNDDVIPLPGMPTDLLLIDSGAAGLIVPAASSWGAICLALTFLAVGTILFRVAWENSGSLPMTSRPNE